VPSGHLDSVERFLAETDFHESSVLVVQRRVEAGRSLGFEFLDRLASPRALLRVRHRDREQSSGISTLLLRIPAEAPTSLTVTIVGGAAGGLDRSVTFGLPNELVSESMNAGPIDRLGDPSGVILADSEVASRFLPDEDPYSEFVRATTFGRSYLLVLQTHVQSGGGYVWPRSVVRSGERLAVAVWRQGFTGGPSAEFGRLLLARLPGQAPERGTATIYPAGANISPEVVTLPVRSG